MRSQKLLLSSDRGSAPIDFVLITLPTSLLVLPLIALFGLAQEKIVTAQTQYEIARFSSMADVTDSEADDYRLKMDNSAVVGKYSSDGLCFFQSQRVVEKQIVFWPYLLNFEVTGQANCEKD